MLPVGLIARAVRGADGQRLTPRRAHSANELAAVCLRAVAEPYHCN